MRIFLLLLCSVSFLSAMPQKEIIKQQRKSHRKPKVDNLRHKITHTESFEEELVRNPEKLIAMGHKKKKKKRIRKIIAAIFTFGLSLLAPCK